MEEERRQRRPNHLAWHETLMVHELVAMQSTALMKMKMFVGNITDSRLKKIYTEGIKNLENHLRELLKYYALAPRLDEENEETRNIESGFYAAELLSFSKSAVKAYAATITETATPALRDTLTRHLQKCIQMHATIYEYMFDKGMYPSYNLPKLLEGDMKRARQALEMRPGNMRSMETEHIDGALKDSD